ncbi:DUF58 domain-containing protein [Nocardioides acrostichi]|uniref:DUF58 domain-containing protein n=1 Tax=Nocardioides acrostichi TaxID=2784339 RepID=A0A930YF17_9ACTN|nr:DUF58 domain-containing protein [Nocardioides acrostichi]MBF4164004.1 DUF58 domain-containing protein [Nocardioides acrostichi]
MAGHVTRVRARLALVSHRRVLGLLEGQYAAVQTGRGLDFNDLREYVRGDDVKDIDWKATARSREPLVRRYVAERRHTVWLVMPTGREMAAAADTASSKTELALLVAGIVGWVAASNGDRVGCAYGDAGGSHLLPATTGELHLERCLTAVDDASGLEAADDDLPGLLGRFARTVRGRGIMLLVCGLPDLDDHRDEVVRLLRRLRQQHEVLVVSVGDADPGGSDASGAGGYDLDTAHGLPPWARGDALLTAELARSDADRLSAFASLMNRSGVVHRHVISADAALPAVVELLERHRHARRQ